jgi:hypothetical protein
MTRYVVACAGGGFLWHRSTKPHTQAKQMPWQTWWLYLRYTLSFFSLDFLNKIFKTFYCFCIFTFWTSYVDKVSRKDFFSPRHNSPQWANASSLSRIHDHTQTHHTRYDSSGRVISPTQRETSTWEHTTFTRDKLPCPRRDSNPQSQQPSDRKPTH